MGNCDDAPTGRDAASALGEGGIGAFNVQDLANTALAFATIGQRDEALLKPQNERNNIYLTRTTQSKPPIVRRRNSFSNPASAQEEHTSSRKKQFGHQQSDAHKQTNQQTNKNTPNKQKHKQTHNTRSRAHKHTPL